MLAQTMPTTSRTVAAGTDYTSPKRRQGTDLASSLALDQQPPFVLLRSWTASWSGRWNPVDGLANGLTPIMTPLGVAVEEIRRTIPLGLADRPAPSADSVQNSSRQDTLPIA
jgi:hypothetical protein